MSLIVRRAMQELYRTISRPFPDKVVSSIENAWSVS